MEQHRGDRQRKGVVWFFLFKRRVGLLLFRYFLCGERGPVFIMSQLFSVWPLNREAGIVL